jgi:hypothetical protein
MDDKWFSFVEGDRLYMHRSWTAHAVFEAELRPRADDCVDVTNLSRNADKRQFNMDDRAARDLFDRLLTRLADGSLISPAPKRSDAKTRHDRHFSMAIDRHFSMALDIRLADRLNSGRYQEDPATKRRRNRTFQAGGCPALPVLKAGSDERLTEVLRLGCVAGLAPIAWRVRGWSARNPPLMRPPTPPAISPRTPCKCDELLSLPGCAGRSPSL